MLAGEAVELSAGLAEARLERGEQGCRQQRGQLFLDQAQGQSVGKGEGRQVGDRIVHPAPAVGHGPVVVDHLEMRCQGIQVALHGALAHLEALVVQPLGQLPGGDARAPSRQLLEDFEQAANGLVVGNLGHDGCGRMCGGGGTCSGYPLCRLSATALCVVPL